MTSKGYCRCGHTLKAHSYPTGIQMCSLRSCGCVMYRGDNLPEDACVECGTSAARCVKDRCCQMCEDADSTTHGRKAKPEDAVSEEVMQAVDIVLEKPAPAVPAPAEPAEPTPGNKRGELLAAANRAVNGRTEEYGGPENSFETIARLWSIVLGQHVSPEEVAICLMQVKVARLKTNPAHADSWADIAGYAACGFEVSDAGM